MYGLAQHSLSEVFFLKDLHIKCQSAFLPVVLGGGDFNLIRSAADKNSDNDNFNLIDSFNDFISANELMEIKRGLLGLLGQINNPAPLWWS